jgi:ribonuclease E
MAETPRKDHWSALLESIGLANAAPQQPAETAPVEPTPAPEAAAPVEPPAQPVAAAPAAPVEPPKPAAKKPAKTSGHWGKLASMLGLTVAQPEAEAEVTAAAAAAPPAATPPAATSDELPSNLFASPARTEVEPRPAASQRGERDRGDRAGRGDQRRDRGPRAEKAPDREVHRDEERRSPRREGNAPRRSFGEGLIEDWPPETHPEPSAESYESEDFVASETELPAAEERLGFDRPADEEGGEYRRRRRRRRRGRSEERSETHVDSRDIDPRGVDPRDIDSRVEDYIDEPYADEYPADPRALDEEDVVDEEPIRRRAPGDSEGGEDRGPRRRRRRRRGGGQREEGAREERALQGREDRSDEEDFDSEQRAPSSGGRKRSQRRAASPEDNEVDEMLHAELQESSAEGHAHKKIPTWEDTVGLLIERNLSMRSERPETRGGHRGRRPPNRGR